jgi:hypothetical protein
LPRPKGQIEVSQRPRQGQAKNRTKIAPELSKPIEYEYEDAGSEKDESPLMGQALREKKDQE